MQYFKDQDGVLHEIHDLGEYYEHNQDRFLRPATAKEVEEYLRPKPKAEATSGYGEIKITQEMGGQIKDFMKEYANKPYVCQGTCRKIINANDIRGYPHSGGLRAADKSIYWVYVHCNTCNYDTSFGKMERAARIARKEMEEAKIVD